MAILAAKLKDVLGVASVLKPRAGDLVEHSFCMRRVRLRRQGERAPAGEGGHGGGWRGWFEAARDQRLGTWGISSLPMRMYGVVGTRGAGG